MKFTKYKATFFGRQEFKNEETGELEFKLVQIGPKQDFFYFHDDKLSRTGRAYNHAQGKQKDAVAVELELI